MTNRQRYVKRAFSRFRASAGLLDFEDKDLLVFSPVVERLGGALELGRGDVASIVDVTGKSGFYYRSRGGGRLRLTTTSGEDFDFIASSLQELVDELKLWHEGLEQPCDAYLIDRFFVEEFNDYVRARIEEEVAAGDGLRCLTFNVFNLALDFDLERVTVEDELDVSAECSMSLRSFLERVRRGTPGGANMDVPEELAGSDVKARLPIALQRMIDDGSWASGGAACDERISLSVARQWDPAAIGIHLQIPRLSIADEVSRNPLLAEIWNLSDIDPEQCFPIGDFGMGSDNPIVIDLTEDPAPIRTQQWEPEAKWITIASSFDEFCALLGI